MNILVTGGAGFIGSGLIEELLQMGHQIICIDNFDDFYDPKIKEANITKALGYGQNYKLIRGDIRDKNLLDKTFKENNIDLVIHLAARAGVRPSIQIPELYFDVNINGTLFILETMRKYNVKKLLFASSSSVYGNNKKTPYSETDFVDNPISPYAASKKAGELLCHTYHHLYNFDIFCFRFFTVYGPRQRPEMAIHYFTKNILEGKKIKMFGKGDTKRDYTYIKDITDGLLAAVQRLKGFEVFNLGSSDTTSLIELIRMIEKATGKTAIIEEMPLQPGDVTITYADITKAQRMLDFNPQFPITKGITEFVKWIKG